MRDLFPGYFTPTAQEFTELWREATFAFDANVLLGLYRLTNETRQVFFDVLQRLSDRIFLPNQAAHEYLRNRLSAISARTGSHVGLKGDAEKFVQGLESRVQEHSLPRGKELVEAAKQAARKIADIVDAALKKEPDLLRSDDVLSSLTDLFDGNTGPAYNAPQLDELYKKAAARYARKIPPGYKDDNKGEPDKYGDALIWFQLIDYATSRKKPVIFITRDAKEDWWLQHNGETIGPRPELAQEMKQAAGVLFYMYTTPRFLEFAQQFFNLKPEPTKKATSEIEEIEKQDKQAAAQITYAWMGQPVQFDIPPWEISNPPTYVTTVQWQPDAMAGSFTGLPPIKTVSPEEEAAKTKYFQLLPINGQVFNSSTGKWKCEITSAPMPTGTDRACYRLKFEPEDRIRNPRHLNLWVSAAGLHHDPDWKYKTAIFRIISDWLDSGNSSGEIAYFA